MTESAESIDPIRSFYDEFLDRRMVRYRSYGNRRLRHAGRLVRRWTERRDNVLEIGCGIGVTTQLLARRAKHGTVWAVDLSPRNIQYASRTVRTSNIQWAALDILREPDRLRSWVTRPIDRVVMIDVLEHIPLEAHDELFRTVTSVMAERGDVVMAFPSVEYQARLRAEEPEELQPVDEDITADHLAALGARWGFRLRQWEYKDVWLTDQYVHAVVSKRPSLHPVGLHLPPRLSRLRRKVTHRLERVIRRHHKSRGGPRG
jgi:trans-aconitate 2-methyltransferase